MNVLRGSRDDLLQVLLLILHPRIVHLVLQGDGAELGHVRRHRGWFGTLVDLRSQIHDLAAVVKDGLVRVVRRDVCRRDLRQGRRAGDLHQALVTVEGQHLSRDVLDSSIHHIESIFSRVDVCDDPVVDVDKGLLGALDTKQHSVEELGLEHLVGWQTNLGLLDATRLCVDSQAAQCCLFVVHLICL